MYQITKTNYDIILKKVTNFLLNLIQTGLKIIIAGKAINIA